MTAREIADILIAGKAHQATRKQAIDPTGRAILSALRKHSGGPVIGVGGPARRRLKDIAI